MAADLALALERLALRVRGLESASGDDTNLSDLADEVADLEARVDALERRPAQALIVGGAGGGVGAPGPAGPPGATGPRGERGPVAAGYWPCGWS